MAGRRPLGLGRRPRAREVQQLLAATGIVVDPAVRVELARTSPPARCAAVTLLDREGLPEHIQAWISQDVLEVAADLTARLAVR